MKSSESLDGMVNARSDQNEFYTKMDDFVQRKEEKIRRMREEKAMKEVENCVFSPTIYTRKTIHNHGSSIDEHPVPQVQPEI